MWVLGSRSGCDAGVGGVGQSVMWGLGGWSGCDVGVGRSVGGSVWALTVGLGFPFHRWGKLQGFHSLPGVLF